MLDIIKNLIATLNTIEVHGEQNLSLLYNCIFTLKEMKIGLEKNKEEQETENAKAEMAGSVK